MSVIDTVINWISEKWPIIVIPVAVFLFILFATLWLRRLAYKVVKGWMARIGGEWGPVILRSFRIPTVLWCLLISIYLGAVVSALPQAWRDPTSRGLWSIFILSLTIAAVNIVTDFVLFYGQRLRVPRDAIPVLMNAARIVILIVGVLTILETWGVPTSPILFLIVVLVLAAALALRDAVPNLFAGFQLSATQHIKVGDYIKLDSGEEGYVINLGWNNTRIEALDESTIIIPNNRLLQRTVINYGHPLKKAKEPFRFNTRTHLKELTGLKARNLRELVAILKTAPDSVVYYHAHHFLEEYQYLAPEPSSDFALWVTDALGNEVLGERLASTDTFAFANMEALRERLVSIIEEYLTTASNLREAMPGREFHFIKSVSFIFPTRYVAHDLREFVEALRQISVDSLFFHIFESRLRLGKVLNDFSIWLEDSLGDAELAKEIGRLDPYTYTLEGLRTSLIQIIEKRIK